MHATLPLLAATDFPAITRRAVETLQVNLGYRCNQSCLHCHVNAGPKRTEEMTAETIAELLACLDRNPGIRTLDLTGGAPELNANFRRLVREARARGLTVIDRCNLTILSEPGHEDLAEFLAAQQVEIVASLPCYLEDNVDKQRGKGVFTASIAGLQALNALGYGRDGSGLALNLVYNPQGAELPPPQASLEAAYKAYLQDHFGIVFNRLYCIANMPIARFASYLRRNDQLADYQQLLKDAFNPGTVDGLMCRNTINVSWRGEVFDCDFNQMINLPLEADGDGRPLSLWDLDPATFAEVPIRTGQHCFGCTAGSGSSCGGALA